MGGEKKIYMQLMKEFRIKEYEQFTNQYTLKDNTYHILFKHYDYLNDIEHRRFDMYTEYTLALKNVLKNQARLIKMTHENMIERKNRLYLNNEDIMKIKDKANWIYEKKI